MAPKLSTGVYCLVVVLAATFFWGKLLGTLQDVPPGITSAAEWELLETHIKALEVDAFEAGTSPHPAAH